MTSATPWSPWSARATGSSSTCRAAHPPTGVLAMLWDGPGLAARRVEAVTGSDPAEVRLTSANPVYAPYAVPAHDVHMVGKVVWVLRKA